MMASRNDIVIDLRAGFPPEVIAVRHQTSLIWIEIIAGKRVPDCACTRRAERLKRLSRPHRPYEPERLAA